MTRTKDHYNTTRSKSQERLSHFLTLNPPSFFFFFFNSFHSELCVNPPGGYAAHSLAIMTDAAHLLTDFGSILISIFSLWISSRPQGGTMTFGWHRAGELITFFLTMQKLYGIHFTVFELAFSKPAAPMCFLLNASKRAAF